MDNFSNETWSRSSRNAIGAQQTNATKLRNEIAALYDCSKLKWSGKEKRMLSTWKTQPSTKRVHTIFPVFSVIGCVCVVVCIASTTLGFSNSTQRSRHTKNVSQNLALLSVRCVCVCVCVSFDVTFSSCTSAIDVLSYLLLNCVQQHTVYRIANST